MVDGLGKGSGSIFENKTLTDASYKKGFGSRCTPPGLKAESISNQSFLA
jgi:hypothetical protein